MVLTILIQVIIITIVTILSIILMAVCIVNSGACKFPSVL